PCQPARAAGRLVRAEATDSRPDHGSSEMKAVVFERPGQITLTSLADPTPGSSDVILKVEASGICGTDLHLLNGDISSAHYPVVPGHEFCGEVVAVGRDVQNVRVADFVAVALTLRDVPFHFCGMHHTTLSDTHSALGPPPSAPPPDVGRGPPNAASTIPTGSPAY